MYDLRAAALIGLDGVRVARPFALSRDVNSIPIIDCKPKRFSKSSRPFIAVPPTLSADDDHGLP